MQWYLECWRKYAVFSGRARRREYWMFTLFSFLVGAVVAFVGGMIGRITDGPDGAGFVAEIAYGIYALAALLPSIAVSVRRLHDTGRSGWWILLGLIPYLGALILLILECLDSQPGENTWGPNPKGVAAAVAA